MDGQIKIYHGDFFDFNCEYEENFDCIWDRGGLVALPADQREKYFLNKEIIFNLF